MKSSNVFLVLFLTSALIYLTNGQQYGEDEDDEAEEYDEEGVEKSATTKKVTTTVKSVSATNSSATVSATGSPISETGANGTATDTKSSQTSTSTGSPTRATTEEDDYPEETTTHRLNYIFVPVNNILEHVKSGNITGIVDQALSIRAPPPVRDLVNGIMATIFGFGSEVTNGINNAFNPTPSTMSPINEAIENGERFLKKKALERASATVEGCKNSKLRNFNN